MTKKTGEMPVHYINVPEAVGVFHTYETLQSAIYDLMIAGFSRFDISVLAGKETLEEKMGSAYWNASDLADNPDAPRASFVSEEAIGELEGAVAGGFIFLGSAIAMTAMLTPVSTLAASIAAVAIGGSPGAVIGTLLARRIGKQHKEYYKEQLEHGGLLLWVRTSSPEKEEKAITILKGHSGTDVHIHPWSES